MSLEDATQLWPSLHRVETDWLGRNLSPTVSFELWNDRGDVSCVFTSGDESLSLLEQARSQYRDATVTTETGAFALTTGQPTAVVALPLRREGLLPIRRYDVEGFKADPYGPLVAELLGGGELRAGLQVVVQPAKNSWVRGGWTADSIEMVAERLRSPSVRESLGGVCEIEASKAQRQTAQVVQAQAGMQAFHADVRIVVQADTASTAITRAGTIARVFKRYYTSQSNQGFRQELLRGDDLRTVLEAVATREVTTYGYGLLTTPELAGVAHVPSMSTLTPPVDGDPVSSYDVVPDRAPSFEGES
ncbi:hypothetical protein [Halogranum gelatinilyticum]|uniref:hypothetical protein n=1 Tax=Halogranum gelatinilyticum TaxID=660521 RepID=UPI001113C241|nr:hypothetical protein [Halogranum gelatinilyticum]